MANPTSALVGTIRAAAGAAPPAWDVATVTSAALVGGRVQVRHEGADVTLPKLKSYTPAAGDVVVLGRLGAGLFVVAALG